jgi:hypothetical protein
MGSIHTVDLAWALTRKSKWECMFAQTDIGTQPVIALTIASGLRGGL